MALQVSDKFGYSQSSFKRALSDEGITFQELSSDIRKVYAYDLLINSDVGIEEIALMLGFSTVSSFYRAFKRWNDLTPQEYRQNNKDMSLGSIG